MIVSVTPEAGFVPLEVELVGDVEAVDDVNFDNVEISWNFGDGTSSTGSFTATHTFEQTGTFTVTLTVSEVTGGTTVDDSTATISVTVYAQADLRVSEPFVGQTTVRSQDDLRVTFELFNDAAEVALPFQLGVYLSNPGTFDSDNPPDVDELNDGILSNDYYLIHTETVESFQGEGAEVRTIDATQIRVPDTVPSGNYEVFAYADPGGVVGEIDEENNAALAEDHLLAFVNTSTEGPDLAVPDVSARPSRVNQIETLTIDFEVENYGSEAAVFFDYEVYLSFTNTTLDDDDTLLTSGSIENVASGQTIDIEDLVIDFETPIIILGTYFVLISVDTGDSVEEINESNNVGASSGVVVTDEPIPGTDLRPTSFTFDPVTTFLDGTLSLSVSVLNQGQEAAPRQFFCRAYLSEDDDFDEDDTVLESVSFPILASNHEEEVTVVSSVPGFFDPGIFYLVLWCDPTQQIPESDEDNNFLTAEGRLEIATDPVVDLRFGSFEIQPRTVENGGIVTVEIEVCNDGNNGVGPTITRVYISADNVLDLNDTALVDTAIDPIDYDTCVPVEFEVPAVCDTFQPSYNVFAILDATDVAQETNEENNTAQLDSALTIDGPICDCEIDTLENNPSGTNNSAATPSYVSGRSYSDLTMCDLAIDWYAIPLLAGETVRVTVTFDHDRGDLDMVLRETNRSTIIDESHSSGDREEVIAFVVSETGDYLLEVCGAPEDESGQCGESSNNANVYDMTVEITPPQTGVDLIVANVDLSNTHPVLAEEVEVGFDVINLGDSDAGESTTRIYISDDIEIDPAEDALLSELVLSEVPGASVRHRSVTVEMPGDGNGGNRYMGVVADALNTVPGEIDETNNTGFSDLFVLDAGCFDPLEPNNDLDSAYPVTLSAETTTLTDLLVCTENGDFYEICGETGDFLEMTVTFDSTVGDVDLRLYTDGTQIDRAEGTGDEETLLIDYLAVDQCYTLEVLVAGRDREVPYVLTIETGDAPAELQCSAIGEPNESRTSAQPIGQLLEYDLAICPVFDIDWFELTVSSGTRLEFEFQPIDGEEAVPSYLRMSLWGPSGNFLRNTVSATEPLIYTTTSTGTHYLKVTSLADGPRTQNYRLGVIGITGVDLQPVDYIIEPGIASPGERVQYVLSIVNNRTDASGAFYYGVYLSEDPLIDPEEDTLLREVANDSLEGASDWPADGKITMPLSIAEGLLYYLGVMVDNRDDVEEIEENNNITVLPVQVPAGCSPDTAEPNDSWVDAETLADYLSESGGTTIDLTLCTDDADWYEYVVVAGTHYTIDAVSDDGEGDLDLFIYDSDLDEIVVGDTIGSDEQVDFTAPAGAETVYVVAEPFGMTNLTYNLYVEVDE